MSMEMIRNRMCKRQREALKKTKNLFSAARLEETMNVGYDVSLAVLKESDPPLCTLIGQLVEECLKEPGFYEEVLHGRAAHPMFMSRYPDSHNILIKMVAESFKASLNPNSFFYSGYDNENRVLSSEFIQLIRNRVIMKKWEKFRKAYVFHKELATALSDMDNNVDVPVELPCNMPFETVYFEFPEDSELSKHYLGVFIDVNRSSGLTHIMSENVRVINRLTEDAKTMQNVSGDTLDWLDIQKKRNLSDKEKAEGNEYISLHLLFVAKTLEDNGFHDIYTYIMALSADRDGICHIRKEDVREKVDYDDFAEKENLTDLIMFILNGLMYISANNADMEERKMNGVVKLLPQKNKNKKKKLECVDNRVSVNRCGFIYGATIREYREKQTRENGREGGGSTTRAPHPVRGHYERYHIGKGRSKVVWKLKLPYFNFGSSDAKDKLLVNVSRVKGESQ